MIVKLQSKLEFIPSWNENLSLPDAEQIKIIHKAPTMELYNRLIPKPSLKLSMNEKGEMDGGETEVSVDNSRLVREMVTDVRNLAFELEGAHETKKVVILKGNDFFTGNAPAEVSGLVDEIGSYLQSVLTKKVVDAKN
jgi:hypothetical protein